MVESVTSGWALEHIDLWTGLVSAVVAVLFAYYPALGDTLRRLLPFLPWPAPPAQSKGPARAAIEMASLMEREGYPLSTIKQAVLTLLNDGDTGGKTK